MERVSAPNNHTVLGLGRHWSWENLVSLPLIEAAGLTDPPDVPCICFDGTDE